MAISTINQAGLNAPLTLTSPVLTTPNLGTPSAINLSNATALPAAALPSGCILQVVNTANSTQISGSGTDTETFNFQCAITPKYATSKILAIVTVSGLSNGGNGRLNCRLRYNTTSGGTSGTIAVDNFGVAQNSSGTSGLSDACITYLSSSIGSTSIQYFKITNTKYDTGDTWYAQQYSQTSSITLMEIAG